MKIRFQKKNPPLELDRRGPKHEQVCPERKCAKQRAEWLPSSWTLHRHDECSTGKNTKPTEKYRAGKTWLAKTKTHWAGTTEPRAVQVRRTSAAGGADRRPKNGTAGNQRWARLENSSARRPREDRLRLRPVKRNPQAEKGNQCEKTTAGSSDWDQTKSSRNRSPADEKITGERIRTWLWYWISFP
jgi:hypothetical protein